MEKDSKKITLEDQIKKLVLEIFEASPHDMIYYGDGIFDKPFPGEPGHYHTPDPKLPTSNADVERVAELWKRHREKYVTNISHYEFQAIAIAAMGDMHREQSGEISDNDEAAPEHIPDLYKSGYEAGKEAGRLHYLSEVGDDPWNLFYQLRYHSALTDRDIFTFGFEAGKASTLKPVSQPVKVSLRECAAIVVSEQRKYRPFTANEMATAILDHLIKQGVNVDYE